MSNFRDLIKQNGGGVYSPSNKPTLDVLSGTAANAANSTKLEGKTKAQVVAEARSGLASATHTHTADDVGALTQSTADSRYLAKTAKAADSDKLDGLQATQFLRSDADDGINGKLGVGNTDTRSAGIYGIYDSNRIGHIWGMGTQYSIPNNGADFGNLYGLAYKHHNNTTGGIMAGGHQAVWCTNGAPKVAIGEHGIWTSGYTQSGMKSIGVCQYSTSETPDYVVIKTPDAYTATTMPSIEIHGRGLGSVGYTNAVKILLGNYYHAGSVYVPRATIWSATGDFSRTIYIVNIGGKRCFAIPAGYCANLNVTLHSSIGSYATSPNGWSTVEMTTAQIEALTKVAVHANKVIVSDNAKFTHPVYIGTGGSTPDATTGSYKEGLTIVGGNQRMVIDTSNATNGGGYIQMRHQADAHPSAYYTLKLNPLGGHVAVGSGGVSSSGEIVGEAGVSASGTAAGQGLQFYGKTAIGGSNDVWLRLNPHSQFSSGIYCGGAGALRHDGRIESPNLYLAAGTNGAQLSTGNASAKTLKLTTAHGYIEMGPGNSSHCHFNTDRSNFWFGKEVRVNGEIYAGSGSYNKRVYHEGFKPSPSAIGAVDNATLAKATQYGFMRTYNFNEGSSHNGWTKVCRLSAGSTGLRIKANLSNHCSSFNSLKVDMNVNGRPAAFLGTINQRKGDTPTGIMIYEVPSGGSYPHYDIYFYIGKYTQGLIELTALGSASSVTCPDTLTYTGGQPPIPSGGSKKLDTTTLTSGLYTFAANGTTLQRIYDQSRKPTPNEIGAMPVTGSDNFNWNGNDSKLPGHYYHNLYSTNQVYIHAFPNATHNGNTRFNWRTKNGTSYSSMTFDHNGLLTVNQINANYTTVSDIGFKQGGTLRTWDGGSSRGKVFEMSNPNGGTFLWYQDKVMTQWNTPKFQVNGEIYSGANRVYHQGWKPTAADIGAVSKAVMDALFPVGHVIVTFNTANPSTYGYPGTWTRMDNDCSLHSTTGTPSTSPTGSNTPSVPLPAHNHNRGTMNIVGQFAIPQTYSNSDYNYAPEGPFYKGAEIDGPSAEQTHNYGSRVIEYDASRAWTGSTSTAGTSNATLDVRGKRFNVAMWRRSA
ncbi:hypothetical protein KGV31_002178 [Vibrio parahaemolyticus]|nr:hypothetical protein [Vibrio parahaemolyticus]EHU0344321.1 hypothetical protein [Vibrio parahaemolyticus]EHU0354355.1 hypothetical protein [Vibrio parahaemolyticus]